MWLTAVVSSFAGGTLLLVFQKVLLPLLSDALQPGAAVVRGRWKARLTTHLPDGDREFAETLEVHQIGNRVWGSTHPPSQEPPSEFLRSGNRFAGFIHGQTVVLTFRSRDRRAPYAGSFLGVITAPGKVKGKTMGRLPDTELIVSDYWLEKDD